MTTRAIPTAIDPDEEWFERIATGPIEAAYGPLFKHLADADLLTLRRDQNDPGRLVVLPWKTWQRISATLREHWAAGAR